MHGLLGGNQSADKHRMVPPFILNNETICLLFGIGEHYARFVWLMQQG